MRVRVLSLFDLRPLNTSNPTFLYTIYHNTLIGRDRGQGWRRPYLSICRNMLQRFLSQFVVKNIHNRFPVVQNLNTTLLLSTKIWCKRKTFPDQNSLYFPDVNKLIILKNKLHLIAWTGGLNHFQLILMIKRIHSGWDIVSLWILFIPPSPLSSPIQDHFGQNIHKKFMSTNLTEEIWGGKLS